MRRDDEDTVLITTTAGSVAVRGTLHWVSEKLVDARRLRADAWFEFAEVEDRRVAVNPDQVSHYYVLDRDPAPQDEQLFKPSLRVVGFDGPGVEVPGSS